MPGIDSGSSANPIMFLGDGFPYRVDKYRKWLIHIKAYSRSKAEQIANEAYGISEEENF